VDRAAPLARRRQPPDELLEEPDVVVHTSSGEVVVGDASELARDRELVLARQVRLFGEEGGLPGLYGIGPRPELLGRRADAFAVATGGGTTFESYGETTYDPESPFAPVRVYGRLHGVPGGRDVAIAVNGEIVAVTRSFEDAGRTLVSAVVPERAFRPGPNAVRVYLVEGAGDDAVLRELPATS